MTAPTTSELIEKLKERIGQEFDGECHLTEAEALQIASRLADLEREGEEATDYARGWHSAVEAILTTTGLSSALGAAEAVQAMRDRATQAEAAERSLEEARALLNEVADAQPLPESFRWTGTEDGLESLFDAERRHTSSKPIDYLRSWLPMFRPFAFATKDDSWGELEKLICITLRNYVRQLAKAARARAFLALPPQPPQPDKSREGT